MNPNTYIHPDAKIGKNVVVEPFAYIAGDVEIGDGTWIGPNVSILDGARIGKNCSIFPGAVISAIPQDLKFKGEKTTAEIGDNTTIRECVTVNRGTSVANRTVVGSNCLLMAYVHIAHDCFVGDHCVMANLVTLAGEVKVGDYTVIGGLAAVHQFVAIGEHVMIGGTAKVRKDVPPFIKADRDPLAYVGVNSIGLRRRGFPHEKISEIQDLYRILYQSDMNNSDAVMIIQEQISESPEKEMFLKFMEKSTRGIIRGYNSVTDRLNRVD